MGERKHRWVVVTPTGDEIVFGSLTELQEAVMGGEGEDEPEAVASGTTGAWGAAEAVNREKTLAGIPLPGTLSGTASPRAVLPGGRVTNVGGFGQQGTGPGGGGSATALLRQTPAPLSGPRGRARAHRVADAQARAPVTRARHTTPAGVFALPAPARGPEALARRHIGPSGTVPGLFPPSRQTSPGIAAPKVLPEGPQICTAPRLSSVSPTCPGLVALRPTTSPGIHPAAMAKRAQVAAVNPMPTVPHATSPARATPSPEPSLDAVDAVWAAMLQSTSKFVPFALARIERAAQPLERAAETPYVAPPPQQVAQTPYVAQPQYVARAPYAEQPEDVVSEGIESVPDSGERALSPPYELPQRMMGTMQAMQAMEVPQWMHSGHAPPPLPASHALNAINAGMPGAPYFADYDAIPNADALAAMPPPSLPVRAGAHAGPDLSDAMRAQIPMPALHEEGPRQPTPPYSIPSSSSYDERDTPSSASMQLMQPERRFPRWWLPLIAATAFGAGVLLVVGHESTSSSPHPEPHKSAAAQTESKAPTASASAATAPAPTAQPQAAPEPIAPTPMAPAPIATSEPASVSAGSGSGGHRSDAPAVTARERTTERAAKEDRGGGKSASDGQGAQTASSSADGERAPSAVKPAGDAKSAYGRAVEAQRAGDSARARTLFAQVAEKEPHNFEAQTGLADAQRAQGDKAGAIVAYRRALAENPAFFPALLGLADTLWDSGEQSSAAERYKEIAQRFSPSMYPGRVRERAGGTESSDSANSAPKDSAPKDSATKDNASKD